MSLKKRPSSLWFIYDNHILQTLFQQQGKDSIFRLKTSTCAALECAMCLT